MVAIPVVKIVSLTVKTLSKPMASAIKRGAQSNQAIRGLLNNMGQAAHQLSLRVSIRIAGHTTTKIKPLDPEKAVKAGSDLLAEGFVWGVGGGLVIFEYVNSNREKNKKDQAAKEKKAKEDQDRVDALEAIRRRLEILEKTIQDSKVPPAYQAPQQDQVQAVATMTGATSSGGAHESRNRTMGSRQGRGIFSIFGLGGGSSAGDGSQGKLAESRDVLSPGQVPFRDGTSRTAEEGASSSSVYSAGASTTRDESIFKKE